MIDVARMFANDENERINVRKKVDCWDVTVAN